MIELKLDVDTLFEWQKHSQKSAIVPHYEELLEFIDLRAQASETSCTTQRKKQLSRVTLFTANACSNCVCKTEKHPLYVCPKFKALSHGERISTIKANNLCSNCLTDRHFKRHCKSAYKCKVCQKVHHTLLHVDSPNPVPAPGSPTMPATPLSAHTAMKLRSNVLLMTCRVSVKAPDGSSVEV